MQTTLVLPIRLPKPSLYQVLVRYRREAETDEPIELGVSFSPGREIDEDARQTGVASVDSADVSSTMILERADDRVAKSFFAERRGTYTLELERRAADGQLLYIDYVVFIPAAYYEAKILSEQINEACSFDASTAGAEPTHCRRYVYVKMPIDSFLDGARGFAEQAGGGRHPAAEYDDAPNDDRTGAILNADQPEVSFELDLDANRPYTLVLEYLTLDDNSAHNIDVEVRARAKDADADAGSLYIYTCALESTCRSVVVDPEGRAQNFVTDSGRALVRLVTYDVAAVVIHRLYAVPSDVFDAELVAPRPLCLRTKSDECEPLALGDVPASTAYELTESLELPFTNDMPAFGNVQAASVRLANGTLTLSGDVAQEGNYTMLVEYYNPQAAAVDADVALQNGENALGTVRLAFCPSTAGCRSVIELKKGGVDGGSQYHVVDRFVATIEMTPRDIWISKM